MNNTFSFIIFISIVLGVYGLMNYYFIRKHKNVVTGKTLPRILLYLVLTTIILTPVATIIFSGREVPVMAAISGFVGYGWLAFLFLFLVTHGTADIVLFMVERLGRTVPKDAAKWIFGICISVNLLILVYGAFDARNIRIETVSIYTDKLPIGTTPIKIAQISDVHFSALTGMSAALRIEKKIEVIKPDIIVCTGDLLDRGIKDEEQVKAILRRLPAPMGKFAIPGNHEYFLGLGQSKAFIEETGFTYLRDSTSVINDSINIVGIDDRTGMRFGQTTGRSEADVLGKLNKTLYTIMLKHQPLVEESSTPFYDLQLSGHTHAGQIFPFAVIVKLVFPYFSGMYAINDSTKIYVNRGTGTWGPPFRFLASPEITVITLAPLH